MRTVFCPKVQEIHLELAQTAPLPHMGMKLREGPLWDINARNNGGTILRQLLLASGMYPSLVTKRFSGCAVSLFCILQGYFFSYCTVLGSSSSIALSVRRIPGAP